MDEAATQAMLKHFYETAIDDVTGSSELYADDAVLEFPQAESASAARPT